MPERRWLARRRQRRPVDLEDRRAHRHEVADGVAEHDQARRGGGRRRVRPAVSTAWMVPERVGPQDERRRGRRCPRAAGHEGDVGTSGLAPSSPRRRRVPRVASRAATATGRMRCRNRSKYSRNSSRPTDEAQARQAHADVRDRVRLDPADDGDGEHQRADQLRQDELEPAVAVPQAHVARGEDAGRLLHAEDRHRDHEAGQRDHGRDRGRHDGRGGLR